jgi:exoribonuclease R
VPATKFGLPRAVLQAPGSADVTHGLERIRTDLQVPDAFPPEVLAAAERAAAAPRLPDLDRTDLELLTIDPPGSKDLDQALHIAARPDGGFTVSYAIADVAAFVSPGDPIDREAHRRGETFYGPDARSPLHPPVLSEGAASLLPGQDRPALLWTVQLDARGATTDADVVRALVRSREQLTYEQAQDDIDHPGAGGTRATLALLAVVGPLREQRERERGGVSLNIPEQEVVPASDGSFALTYRSLLPVEGWNAQISLLTGMAAAHLMIYARVGLVRTMPPATHQDLRRLHAVARALGIRWPAELDYPELVRSLDASRPADAAMLNACTVLFRGAGYAAFDGSVPEDAEHAALASDYSHVTAPLRRLVDRYAGEVCVALCAGTPVPDWVREALPGLPAEMARADQAAHRYERAVVDWVEACVLARRVGETFTGTVVEVDPEHHRGTVVIQDPAVEARVTGDGLPLGHELQVRLTQADPEQGRVTFEAVPSDARG